MRGNGKDVIRGGWGIYMDMAYTNSNALFAASDATGEGFGAVLSVDNQQGIRNPDGTLLPGRPAALEPREPEPVEPERAAAVRPVHRSAAADAVHAPDVARLVARADRRARSFTADFVRADGRDLNVRPRINTRIIPNGAARAWRSSASCPNAIGTRPAISGGESKYTALITGVKRRLTNNLDFSVTYTLAEARSQIGTAADELNANLLQDATLLYDDPRVYGPTSRTDARHSGSFAMVWHGQGLHRSRRPTSTARRCRCRPSPGVDTNLNGENNDLPRTRLPVHAASARRRRTSAPARPGTAAAARGARR